jgi:hypothetical protein
VKFFLVSVDDDRKKLDAYVAERKFAFPVLLGTREMALEKFKADNTPTTFYIDAAGVIRYQTEGGSIFGESVDRVVWYIDEMRKNPTSQP